MFSPSKLFRFQSGDALSPLGGRAPQVGCGMSGVAAPACMHEDTFQARCMVIMPEIKSTESAHICYHLTPPVVLQWA